MNITKKLVYALLILLITVGYIVYWQMNHSVNRLTKQDIKYLESRMYASDTEAMQVLLSQFKSQNGYDGFTMNPEKYSHPKFYTMLISRSEIENKYRPNYYIAYLIQDEKKNNYHLEIEQANIGSEIQTKPLLKEKIIGNTVAKYYAGDSKKMPFGDNASGLLGGKHDISIRFENKLNKVKLKNNAIEEMDSLKNEAEFDQFLHGREYSYSIHEHEKLKGHFKIIMIDYKKNNKNYAALGYIKNKELVLIRSEVAVNKNMKTIKDQYAVDGYHLNYAFQGDVNDLNNVTYDLSHNMNDHFVINMDIEEEK